MHIQQRASRIYNAQCNTASAFIYICLGSVRVEALTHCNALSPGIPGARYDANAVGDSNGTHPYVCTQYICSQQDHHQRVVWDPRYLDVCVTHACT